MNANDKNLIRISDAGVLAEGKKVLIRNIIWGGKFLIEGIIHKTSNGSAYVFTNEAAFDGDEPIDWDSIDRKGYKYSYRVRRISRPLVSSFDAELYINKRMNHEQ